MKKFLIVDGSSIFYRAFYAMPPLTAPDGKPTGAVVGFANIILKILREQSPDLAAVALDTAKKTFRNEIFSEYKATRPQMPDDLAEQLPLMKEFVDVLGVKSCAASSSGIGGRVALYSGKISLRKVFLAVSSATAVKSGEYSRKIFKRIFAKPTIAPVGSPLGAFKPGMA